MDDQFFLGRLSRKGRFLLGIQSTAHLSKNPDYKIHSILLQVDLEDRVVQGDIWMAHGHVCRLGQRNKCTHVSIDYQRSYLVGP